MKPLNAAYKIFTSKALDFIYLTLLQPIFFISTIFLFAGIFYGLLVIINLLGYLNPDNGIYVVGIFTIATLVFGFYAYAAFRGSLIKGYSMLALQRPMALEEFIEYAVLRGMRFFAISIIKVIIYFFLFLPLAGIYYFRPDLFASSLTLLVVAIIYIPLIFAVEYLLSLSYIGIATRDFGVKKAITTSYKMAIRFVGDFFPLYLVYVLVWWARLIPLVGLVIHFTLYPIAITALILQFQEDVVKII